MYVKIGDGVFDKLSNKEVVQCVWNCLEDKEVNNIHSICGKASEYIIKNSLFRKSLDNVTVVILCFKNFKNYFKNSMNKFQKINDKNYSNIKENKQNRSNSGETKIQKENNKEPTNNIQNDNSLDAMKLVAHRQINTKSSVCGRNINLLNKIESEKYWMKEKENWSKTVLVEGITQKKIHLKYPN